MAVEGTKTNLYITPIILVMRQLPLLASAAAMALGAIFATTSCSKNDGGATIEKGALDATATDAAADTTGARATALAAYIRYVDMTRLQNEYTLFREYANADSVAQIKLASYHNQLLAPINKKAEEVQNKYQEGRYLSQASLESDQAALQKMQQDASSRFESRQVEFMTQLADMQKQIQDSIDSVVKHICETKGYDAILNSGAGLYFNPALDITDEVVNELNRRYKPGNDKK
jgi:Skp family chaperone for outer membrane proteins